MNATEADTYHIKFGLRRFKSFLLERVEEPWKRGLVNPISMPSVDRDRPRDVSDTVAALCRIECAGNRRANLAIVIADDAFDGCKNVQDT